MINGQLQVAARDGFIATKLPHDTARRTDLDPAKPGTSAEIGLALGLDSDLAELVPRNLQDGFRRSHPGEVAFADRPDIADNMREIRPQRIHARQADLRRDAGQGGCVDRDFRDIFPGQLVRERDRHERTPAIHLLQRAIELGLIKLYKPPDLGNRLLHVAGILSHDDNPVVLTVLRDGDPVPVKDLAPARRDEAHVDAVVLGQKLVVFRLVHLQLAHPQHKGSQEGKLASAQQERAPRDYSGTLVGFCPRAIHFPSLSGPIPVPGMELSDAENALGQKNHNRIEQDGKPQVHDRHVHAGATGTGQQQHHGLHAFHHQDHNGNQQPFREQRHCKRSCASSAKELAGKNHQGRPEPGRAHEQYVGNQEDRCK